MIIAAVTIIISTASAISMFADVPGKVDPWVHTETEAAEEHFTITMAADEQEQTQAGFNAYTLGLLLEQEIEILKLQLEVEKDPDERKLLEAELKIKLEFIEKLEAEKRKQMMKGAES